MHLASIQDFMRRPVLPRRLGMALLSWVMAGAALAEPGPRVEDHPTQHVRYASSPDGVKWSEPQEVDLLERGEIVVLAR